MNTKPDSMPGEYEGVTLRHWRNGGSIVAHLNWPDGMYERITWPSTNAEAGEAEIRWMLAHGAKEMTK